ncbi:MAG TPA: FAD:protein FMN transferase [Kineosporiaceae bacterium]|nr:FAD:protein FMN transferase [Kineosporiaceae bacterium]
MTLAAPALPVPSSSACRTCLPAPGDDDLPVPSGQARTVDVIHIWDTVVSVELRLVPAGVDVPAALAAVHALLADVDATFSVFRPDSLVSALRRGEHDEERLLWHPRSHAERDLAEVISYCRKARVLTNGAFDPWAVPGGFDPSGLVKGWAAGRSVRLLNQRGIRHVMVNAGGDIAVTGGASRLAPWRIGIRDPLDPQRLIAVVEITDGGVATSGRYERGNHLHQPVSIPAGQEYAAATAIGPDPALTDAFATALAAGGHPAATGVTLLPGYTFLVTDPHNRHHQLPASP